MLPLLHWLPVCWHRALLGGIGQDFFAQEANLNLLSSRSLAAVADRAGIAGFTITSVSLAGLPTNLLLAASKPPCGALAS
jgi:hypothetical protein